jgi:uncharacterized repeat protein (TIGR01451 family)
MMRRIAGLFSLALLLTLLLAVAVHAIPPLPFSRYGTVQVNGANVAAGTTVGAWCGGVQYAETEVEYYDGQSVYAIDVPGDDPETDGQKEGCASGEEVQFTITVGQDVLQADQTATWAEGQDAELNLTAFLPLPALDLEKYTNGQDADNAPGPYLAPGEPLTWTYTITNTGNVDVADIVVSDDQEPGLSCGQSLLAIDETFSCTLTSTASGGQYANLATASGLYASAVVSDTDPSHYFGVEPAIDLEKHTNGQDADTAPGPFAPAGGPVTWTYRVTNTGNVGLTDLVVTDDQEAGLDCTRSLLAAGESFSCTLTGVALSGEYANEATVSGAYGSLSVNDTDRSHYYSSYSVYLPLVLR